MPGRGWVELLAGQSDSVCRYAMQVCDDDSRFSPDGITKDRLTDNNSLDDGIPSNTAQRVSCTPNRKYTMVSPIPMKLHPPNYIRPNDHRPVMYCRLRNNAGKQKKF